MTSTEVLVRRTVFVSVPTVGKSGKSTLIGFYIRVRQRGCRQSSQHHSAHMQGWNVKGWQHVSLLSVGFSSYTETYCFNSPLLLWFSVLLFQNVNCNRKALLSWFWGTDTKMWWNKIKLWSPGGKFRNLEVKQRRIKELIK